MNLHKRKRSPFWYARGSVDGQKFFLKTELKWRKWNEQPGPDAYAAWAKVRDAFAHSLAEKKGQTANAAKMLPTLENLEVLFFKHHETKHTRPKTLEGYRYIWASLHRNLGTLEAALGPRGMAEYVGKRSRMDAATTGTKISPRTVRAEVKQFFAAWRYAESFGLQLPDKPPFPDNFEPDREPNRARKGKYRKPKLIWAFIDMLKSQEAKDRALFIALTGIRFEELARIESLRLKKASRKGIAAYLILPSSTTKGKKQRVVGLTPTALAIYRRNKPFKSKANRSAWTTASRKLGLTYRLHSRDLRASFASGVILAGASETHKNMVMGHWEGVSSRYQKAYFEAAARVARAADRWLAKGKRAFERGAQGVHTAKIVDLGQKLKCV